MDGLVAYALSKKKDAALQEQINNLTSIGRFLSIWNCVTGLPTTNPTVSPYTYKTGDYYIVGNKATGSYTHAITIAGTASDLGIHEGTYSVSFTISNQIGTQYSTIAAIGSALGETGATATGVLHTTDAGDIDIVKAIEWEQEGIMYVALLDETGQKVALTKTTADTLSDSVSGGLVNYKPNGSSYISGTASTTVESGSVQIGWVYYYDGSSWMILAGKVDSQYELTDTVTAKKYKLSVTNGVLGTEEVT